MFKLKALTTDMFSTWNQIRSHILYVSTNA